MDLRRRPRQVHSIDSPWRGDDARRPHQPGHWTQLDGGSLVEVPAVPAQAGEPGRIGGPLAWAYALRTRSPSQTRNAIQVHLDTTAAASEPARPARLSRGIVSGYFVAPVIDTPMPTLS